MLEPGTNKSGRDISTNMSKGAMRVSEAEAVNDFASLLTRAARAPKL
jgi:hypothetical protein